MSHATQTHNSPAWSVENTSGHVIALLPCKCCAATTMALNVEAATVVFHLDDIDMLEELRDNLDTLIEYHKTRPTPEPSDDEDGDTAPSLPRQWQGHAPSGVREDFHEWVDMVQSSVTVTPAGVGLFEDEIATPLSACTDILPCEYCEALDLPHGSTYALAVRDLRKRLR